MTQANMEIASGSSKNSLTEAIGNAVAEVLGGTNGDHKYSLTIIVDGYEYDGEEYHVRVRAIIFDLDADREELYERLNEEREQAEEPDLANDMYAAFYHKETFYSDNDDVAEEIQHMVEGMEDVNPPEDTTIIASPGMHDQLERENNVQKERTLIAGNQFNNTDSAPTLTPPGMSGGLSKTHSDAGQV